MTLLSTFTLSGWLTTAAYPATNCDYDWLHVVAGSVSLGSTTVINPLWNGKDAGGAWATTANSSGFIQASDGITGYGPGTLNQNKPGGYTGGYQWGLSPWVGPPATGLDLVWSA